MRLRDELRETWRWPTSWPRNPSWVAITPRTGASSISHQECCHRSMARTTAARAAKVTANVAT